MTASCCHFVNFLNSKIRCIYHLWHLQYMCNIKKSIHGNWVKTRGTDICTDTRTHAWTHMSKYKNLPSGQSGLYNKYYSNPSLSALLHQFICAQRRNEYAGHIPPTNISNHMQYTLLFRCIHMHSLQHPCIHPHHPFVEICWHFWPKWQSNEALMLKDHLLLSNKHI
jgi:hypothetical protein